MKKIIRVKVLLLLLFMMVGQHANSQLKILNMPEHDSKLYYFGLTFGFNMSTFRTSATESFAMTDTFLRIQPLWKPGFNVGIMGNLRLSSFIDLRFIPTLIFSEKAMDIWNADDENPEYRTIESIYMQLPLQLKFKSDRINNFRFYGLLGGKFDYDLASNARSRSPDEWLRVRAIDIGLDVGVGFEFFYPNFIFAPEIKISQGFLNAHFNDSSIPLSNAIDRLTTRMIVISIHLQG